MNVNKINAWVEELEADRKFWQDQAAFWRTQALLMAEVLGKRIEEPKRSKFDEIEA